MPEKINNKTISENLVLYRKLHGMTQAELADAIGYSDKSVSKWERGEGTPDIFLLHLRDQGLGACGADGEMQGDTGKNARCGKRPQGAGTDKEKSARTRQKAKEEKRSVKRAAQPKRADAELFHAVKRTTAFFMWDSSAFFYISTLFLVILYVISS